ncbi:rhomboid family intramembrane serine protease [soil metagenome]
MITLIIIAITCGVSILTMQNEELKNKYMFNAYAISHYGEWWRFLTHGLLHANFMHLLFNMYALYSFGTFVEKSFENEIFSPVTGMLVYILLYVGGLIVSSIYSFFKHRNNPQYNALGASGAVSAVVYSGILLSPLSSMGILFIPIHFPAWIFGILFLVISYFLGRRGGGNIGHDAHFWGAVYGFILPIIFRPELWQSFVGYIREFLLYGGLLH